MLLQHLCHGITVLCIYMYAPPSFYSHLEGLQTNRQTYRILTVHIAVTSICCFVKHLFLWSLSANDFLWPALAWFIAVIIILLLLARGESHSGHVPCTLCYLLASQIIITIKKICCPGFYWPDIGYCLSEIFIIVFHSIYCTFQPFFTVQH